MQTTEKPKWLTLAEAAARAGRSYSWAYERAAGRAFVCHPDRSRCIKVSAESVEQMIVREQAEQNRRSALCGPRLVVDNTK